MLSYRTYRCYESEPTALKTTWGSSRVRTRESWTRSTDLDFLPERPKFSSSDQSKRSSVNSRMSQSKPTDPESRPASPEEQSTCQASQLQRKQLSAQSQHHNHNFRKSQSTLRVQVCTSGTKTILYQLTSANLKEKNQRVTARRTSGPFKGRSSWFRFTGSLKSRVITNR